MHLRVCVSRVFVRPLTRPPTRHVCPPPLPQGGEPLLFLSLHAVHPPTHPPTHFHRVENLYFSYLFMLRAAMKAAPILRAHDYDTGLPQVDARTQRLMRRWVWGGGGGAVGCGGCGATPPHPHTRKHPHTHPTPPTHARSLLDSAELKRACPIPFDEGRLWKSSDADVLRTELQVGGWVGVSVCTCVWRGGGERCRRRAAHRAAGGWVGARDAPTKPTEQRAHRGLRGLRSHLPPPQPPLQAAFQNITRIMDCVGCEKCKMWGKLQLLGIATSLKILFSAEDCGGHPPEGGGITGGWVGAVGGWVGGWVGWGSGWVV